MRNSVGKTDAPDESQGLLFFYPFRVEVSGSGTENGCCFQKT
jgi:hypothetical protein